VFTDVKPEGLGCGSKATQIKKKNTFVDMVISEVLHDLPFNRKQPLKSADDQYIGVLGSKIRNLDFDKVKK